jgi:DNA-binding NarL/FixJ family response regulator
MAQVGTGPEGRPSRARSGRARHPPRLFAVAPSPSTAVLLQSVAAALTTRGLLVEPLGAPGPTGLLPVRLRREDVVLAMEDLPDGAALARVCAFVSGCPARVLVLTAHPPGAAWNALLDAGAASVLGSSAGLDEVAETLSRLTTGRAPADPDAGPGPAPPVRVRDLEPRAQAVVDRLSGVGRVDRMLLALVCTGLSVEQAAARLGLAPEEVARRHDALLRRLGVATGEEAVVLLDLLVAEP